MVPPGGTAHIAGGADPAEVGPCVSEDAGRTASTPTTGSPHTRATAALLLACVPGLAAVLVLVLCADGIGRRATAGARPTVVAARPAARTPRPSRTSCRGRPGWTSLARRTQPPPALRRQGRRGLRPPHRLAQRLRLRRRAPHHPLPLRGPDRRPGLGRHRLQLPRRPLRHHLRGPRGRRRPRRHRRPHPGLQPPHGGDRGHRHLHGGRARPAGDDRRDRRAGRLETGPGRTSTRAPRCGWSPATASAGTAPAPPPSSPPSPATRTAT